ncbi:MAG: TetR/AcrR family transcriptional regulator [Planctomycetota bacterium]|nr:TetR/AcrR family transcriptional regulator [Planctomycetota bacterium]MDA1114036.1 TetR/AcrR family transcriptional regulator [Planctomycetota bacterium]
MPWEKQFDVEEALQRAGDVFWEKGYEATSITDLLQAMGIQKGSFYDTYGSKRAVYLRSLEQYFRSRIIQFQKEVEGLGPKEALVSMLNGILKECLSSVGTRGCFVVNCAVELAPFDEDAQAITQRSLREHEKWVEGLIRKAEAAGELPVSADPSGKAKALLAFILGLRVYARSGAPKSILRSHADQALHFLEH